MIEFTYSRVTLCVCGIMLLASVSVPLAGIYSSNEDVRMTGNADRIAWMLDDIHNYETDTVTIRGWDVLPGSDCSLTVDGNRVVLGNNKGKYVSYTVNPAYFTMKYTDETELRIVDGVLVGS